MSHVVLEERVGKVEQTQAEQGRVQARHGEKLDRMERDISDVAVGVKQLLDREHARPDGLTAKTIAATCGSLVAVAYVMWWLIGSAPSVVSLDRRLDKLDDPQTGRVLHLERRLDKLDGWHATVRR